MYIDLYTTFDSFYQLFETPYRVAIGYRVVHNL